MISEIIVKIKVQFDSFTFILSEYAKKPLIKYFLWLGWITAFLLMIYNIFIYESKYGVYDVTATLVIIGMGALISKVTSKSKSKY